MAKQSTAGSKSRPKAKPKAAAKGTARAASKSAQAPSTGGIHILREDHPWAIDYAGHEPRKDSDLYKKSRDLMNKIAKASQSSSGQAWYYGADPWEDHHGGGLWVHDGAGWFFVKNLAGMEWASQFCADPAKVDVLRANAARLYGGSFGAATKTEMLKLVPDYPFDQVLTTKITTAAHVDQWTDSIFNASVPLPKPRHTGVAPGGHGVHHYPTPVTDIELFKHNDFTLWVMDAERKPTAVVPVHPRGVDPKDPRYADDYGKVAVAYATPGTALNTQLTRARNQGKTMMARADHRLAAQAFKNQ